jgi:general secretion pathway protein G
MHKEKSQRRHREQGFTLIELLIVIIILGLLAALVTPKLVGKVGKSKPKIAQAQLQAFCSAIDIFKLDMGHYPKDLEELVKKVDDPKWEGPYLPKEIPLDPWGHRYEYKCPGEEGRDYDIISYGADGTSGGEGENADIVSWKDISTQGKEAE